MGYQTFAHAGKQLTKAEDIGPGQVELRHLSPALFTEIRFIQLHTHSGVGSVRLNLANAEGIFPLDGFKMVSSNAKKWKITMSDAGAFVITEIT